MTASSSMSNSPCPAPPPSLPRWIKSKKDQGLLRWHQPKTMGEIAVLRAKYRSYPLIKESMS